MAKQQIDIKITNIDAANDDLAVINGDFACVESTTQHQTQLLYNNKNDSKQHPAICVGLINYQDDENGLSQDLPRDASKQFSLDGMTVAIMKLLNTETLGIDAYYP
jgi:hypothetical protein